MLSPWAGRQGAEAPQAGMQMAPSWAAVLQHRMGLHSQGAQQPGELGWQELHLSSNLLKTSHTLCSRMGWGWPGKKSWHTGGWCPHRGAEQQPAAGSCIEKGQTGTELCKQKCSQQSMEVDIPLYWLPVRLHLESLGQSWVLKYNTRVTVTWLGGWNMWFTRKSWESQACQPGFRGHLTLSAQWEATENTEANCSKKKSFYIFGKRTLWRDNSKVQREQDMSIAKDNQHSTWAGLQESTEDVSREWRNHFHRPLLI